MQIPLGDVVHDVYGHPLKDSEGKPLTVVHVLIGALMGSDPRSPNTDGPGKFHRWQLASRFASGDGSVSLDEAAFVKKLVGEAWTPAVVGPVWTILEFKEPSKLREVLK